VLRALRGRGSLGAEARARRWGASGASPAALALLEVTRDDRALLPEPKEVFALALAELQAGALSQEGSDYVFALLSLCATRGSLELVRQGLKTDDASCAAPRSNTWRVSCRKGCVPRSSPRSAQRPAPRASERPTQQRSETQLLDELSARSVLT